MFSLAFCLVFFLVCLAQAAPPMAQSAPPSAAPLADPNAYIAGQFGPNFKLDPKVAPMFGDLDGDGNEDLVLVATSTAPMLSQEQFRYRVEDPYDAYFGTGNPQITSQFSLHFDGSSRCLLVVFGWRQPPQSKRRQVSKFVLINTPFEAASLVNLRLKKRNQQAIEAIDRTTLHALVFWDGRHWHWSAQGMEGDDSLFKMPSQN
jgi:hypothetical protein